MRLKRQMESKTLIFLIRLLYIHDEVEGGKKPPAYTLEPGKCVTRITDIYGQKYFHGFSAFEAE